ncbi:MAG: hypothetical protein P1V51_06240 [Deltaproteobacteria bacterium]|nr:hypothetical protein [Deltaproteobacteria bacterium]
MRATPKTLVPAWLLAGLILLSTAAPGAARAQGRNQFLEEGKRLIAKGKPGEAVEELSRALEFPELPLVQRIEILGYLGAAQHLAGNEAEAGDAWEERVRLDPDGDLPEDLPGEVRSAYVQARAGVVVVEHLPPPGALAGRTVEIRVNLRDRYAATQDLVVFHRRAGKTDYESTALERDDLGWHVKLTMPPLAGLAAAYEYEYYIVAQSEQGEHLHSAGSEDQPLAIRVMAPTDDPGPLTATLPDPVKDPEVESGGDPAAGGGVVIVRKDPEGDAGAGTKDPIDLTAVDLVDAGATGTGAGLDPEDAVAVRTGTAGRDRKDEVIEAVEVEVDPPDGSRPWRKPGPAATPTGSAKWVWITLGVIVVLGAGAAGVVAGTSGDKIPSDTDLGVIRYPPGS